MIYKGCERKMIMIKNTGSDYFDEAYFILKEKQNTKAYVNEDDMLKEANRIVNDNMISLKPREAKKIFKPDIFTFCAGLFTGLFCTTLLFLIIK